MRQFVWRVFLGLRHFSTKSSLLSSLFSSQFFQYLSVFSTKLVLAVSSRSPRGPLPGGFPFFQGNNAHSEKVCSSPTQKEEPPGRLPNSLGNNEHSEKALWPRENHTFEGGSPVFSKKVYIVKWSIFVVSAFPLFSLESVHSGVHSSVP